MNLFKIFLECVWLMLPAIISNIVPGLFRNTLKFLAKPADFNKSWKGKRILGDHKTIRGFVVGVIFAIIIAFVQTRLYFSNIFFKSISLVDYGNINFIAVGFLLGFGALLGDSVKSFFKRRRNVDPGERWIPYDEIDWILGSLILFSVIYVPDAPHFLIMIILFPIFHIIINHIGFYLKIRDKKW
ncbi:MAG: CDP-archaeol synthase [Candidatus Woesearchaeota archaeon]